MKFNQDFERGYENDTIIRNGYLNCFQSKCAWWNERFGMCCIAVDAHLKATEDRARESAICRRGG